VTFIVPFLAAGWIYRGRPENHKRVMLVATTIMILPAVSRMAFLGVPVPVWKFMLVWPLPVYLTMVHDFRTKHMVHPVYVIGIAAMLAMRLVLPLNQSAAWDSVAAHITSLYRLESVFCALNLAAILAAHPSPLPPPSHCPHGG
jgi:hypothetical protein